LNGTIIMILITCTIATFAAQKGGKNISLSEASNAEKSELENDERILISVSNPENVEELINLSTILKSRDNKKGLFALNIITNDTASTEDHNKAKKILDKAVTTASATDIQLNQILRYDINIVNGVTGVIKEHNITDLVLGLHVKTGISESFLGKLTEGILTRCNTTTFVYKPAQPISTIKRHIIIAPPDAEKEIGFPFWLLKIWNISRNTGATLTFYGNDKTTKVIKEIHEKYPIEADFRIFDDWDDFLILSRDVKSDDNLVIIMSRTNKTSYHANMTKVPGYLNKYFQPNSFMLVYPMQTGVTDDETIDLNNPSLLEPIERLDEIGKQIAKLFRKR
jgi:nucleotide-binding universal stress UspA family protein